MSALSSLAEKPDRIKRIFYSKSYNEAGVYSLRVCECGEWRNVLLDDYFPSMRDKEKKVIPAFTRGKGSELWVLLLEKVWAKINGSYDKIIGGFATEALHDFTGAPTLMIDTDPKVMASE